MVPGMKTVGQNGLRGLKLVIGLRMIGPPTGIAVAAGMVYVASGMVVIFERCGVMIPLKACRNRQDGGKVACMDRFLESSGDTGTFAGSRLPPISKTVTSFLERHIAQPLKKDTIQKQAKIHPKGIHVEMAFKEASLH